MIKASIIGATGYAGAELVRLLLSHPQVQIAGISSRSFEGMKLDEVYPAYRGLATLVCENQSQMVDRADVVFAALPHGLSLDIAAECLAKGKIFIDLGADFRLYDEADYQEWYGLTHKNKEVSAQAVYALTELYRDKIQGKKIIGNPGCYPTSVALGMAPAIKAGLVQAEGIIIDSKSGVTGAGREPSQATHFPECNEAFGPYKTAVHRHTPEIEQTVSDLFGQKINVVFVPHLLPVNRGILSTIYMKMVPGVTEEAVRKAYEDFYKDEYFVRVLPKDQTANIKTVRLSNFCDISIHTDFRTGTLIVASAIDNMVKGAAGQAVQNINLLFGLPEQTGLDIIPPAF